MESALPMLIFLGGLLGFGFLIMICIQQNVDLERAEAEAERASQLEAEPVPILQPGVTTLNALLGEADQQMVEIVRNYLAEERRHVHAFVDAPSRGSLLNARRRPVHGHWVRQVEEFLRDEQRTVGAYLASPSPENLHHGLQAVVAA